MSASPTSREPVKASAATSGWAASSDPKLAPSPGSNCATAGGNPASSKISCSLQALICDALAGFMMTGLPHTSAAALMPERMASGKFHGAMTAVGPSAS